MANEIPTRRAVQADLNNLTDTNYNNYIKAENMWKDGEEFVVVPCALHEKLVEMAMSNPIYMVEEFHRVYNLPVNAQSVFGMSEGDISDDELTKLCNLRLNLLVEEMQEYKEAQDCYDEFGIIDALCDIVYVAIGAALSFGLPFRLGMQEVQRSNMSKLDEYGKPIVREEDGKILKGPNFEEPNWEVVFEEHTEEGGKV